MVVLHRTVAAIVAGFGLAAVLTGAGQTPARPKTVTPPAATPKPADPSLAEVRQEGLDVARDLKNLVEQYRSAWEKTPDEAVVLGRFPKELRAALKEYQTRVRGLLAGAAGTAGTVAGHAKADAAATPAGKARPALLPPVGDPVTRGKQAEATARTHRAPDPALMQARAREALLKDLDKAADRVKDELDKLAAAMKEAKADPIKDQFQALVKAIDALEKAAKDGDRKD